MTTIYKLTDQNMQTRGGYQWELGRWYETSGEGELCGPGFLHAYTDSLLAVFLNPIHADIENPRLFIGQGDGGFKEDSGLKVGYSLMMLIEEIPLPVVTTVQRVAFAILTAKTICTEPSWNIWADKWLSGEDRTKESAWSAAWSAAYAAYAVESAAWSAAEFAESAARYAAASAASAARSAAESAGIDLITLAKQAMTH